MNRDIKYYLVALMIGLLLGGISLMCQEYTSRNNTVYVSDCNEIVKLLANGKAKSFVVGRTEYKRVNK